MKEPKKELFNEIWFYYKKWLNNDGSDEQWEQIIEQGNAIIDKYKQDPSTDRECLPYPYLVRQRGDPVRVSVYNPAEHQEESGKDSSSNKKQPPEIICRLDRVGPYSF